MRFFIALLAIADAGGFCVAASILSYDEHDRNRYESCISDGWNNFNRGDAFLGRRCMSVTASKNSHLVNMPFGPDSMSLARPQRKEPATICNVLFRLLASRASARNFGVFRGFLCVLAWCLFIPRLAIADPVLLWPDNCDYYWNIADVKESFLVRGPVADGAFVITCFNTITGAVAGGLFDDFHISIYSPNGGNARIGTGGHQVAVGGVPQNLGTGNLAGDTFHFGPGLTSIDLVKHDGIDPMLPVMNWLVGSIICFWPTESGKPAPDDPCGPQLGDPPLPNRPVDAPDPLVPPFRIFEFAARGPGIELFSVPEPSTISLVVLIFLMVAASKGVAKVRY